MRTFLLFAAGFILLSFSGNDYKANKATAEVHQIMGIYIFSDCKPVAEFTTLGTVYINKKDARKYSPQYQSVRDVLIYRGKEQFKDADGIILHLHDGGLDYADMIKLK